MQEDDLHTYVKAAAQAIDLPLDEARARAVALNLERTLAMARLLDGTAFAPADEPAELYRPAPFPSEDPA